MGKYIAAAFAGMIGLITIAGLGSVSGTGKFDYAEADEERQQKFLDGVADGFEAGFKFSAGNSAEITQSFADADLDLLSFSIRFTDQRIEKISADRFENQRLSMLRQTCKLAEKEKLLDYGITLRVRMLRPSGVRMGAIHVDNEACKRYLG